MKSRIDITKVSPAAYRTMTTLEQYVHSSSLEPGLIHLLKFRASQINGCAYCLDMHSKDARARRSSGSMPSMPGGRHPFTAIESERRWRGSRRSR